MSDREAELKDLRRQVAKAKEAVRATATRIAALPGNARGLGAAANVDGDRSALAAALAEQRSALATLRARERAFATDIEELFDPAVVAGRLAATSPILLAPLRLETRFRMSEPNGPQLWVRVFPDDCLVDSFDPGFTAAEERAGRAFWAESWAAAGDEPARRAAWRRLAAACGVERATWVTRTLRPTDTPPVRSSPEETLLVSVLEESPPDRERDAMAEYWPAVWSANGDASALTAAGAAFVARVGEARAAQLTEQARPVNLADTPPRAPDAPVRWIPLIVAPASEDQRRPAAWSKAAQARLMPHRIALVGRVAPGAADVTLAVGRPLPDPLTCGLDPQAPPAEQMAPDANGGIAMPDEMAWLTDFDRAVADGLGFRIDLRQFGAERGFDRLIALGLRGADSAQASGADIVSLLMRQRYSSTGFEILPQGAATNNTATEAAASPNRPDAIDAGYDVAFADAAPADAALQDGAVLAAFLGLPTDAFNGAPGACSRDQIESRAMNEALWPATLGAFLDEELGDLISDDDIELTRRFFLDHVSGRGPAPAFRIGRQPYGIALTAPFARLSWDQDQGDKAIGDSRFRAGLRRLLADLAASWADKARSVAHVGDPRGDPHQTLLDVIGLHPSSVEFHGRYALGDDHIRNVLRLRGTTSANEVIADVFARWAADGVLKRYFGPTATAPIVRKAFLQDQFELSGPVVDDLLPDTPEVLSETLGLAVRRADGLNYIAWLAREGRTSIENLRRQLGYSDATTPRSLLYFYLREALLRGYRDASLALLVRGGALEPPAAKVARRAPSVVGVAQEERAFPTAWSAMYAVDARITGTDDLRLADYVAALLRDGDGADPRLRAQIDALETLKGLPTARLERLFAEHVDCCSFRLDAWRIGLLREELARRRARSAAANGVHFGAYAVLEKVVPQPRSRRDQPMNRAQRATFGSAPVEIDSSNGGFILAPSINHAVTAGVLRSGHVSNATPVQREPFAVNLTSARVRAALDVLEGVRNGQSLGALLGYSFQRGLHDAHGLAEVNRFIGAIRQRFPLVANRMASTADADVAVETIEARNVIDGKAFAEHLKAVGATYPFGLAFSPSANDAQRRALEAEAQALLALLDAVADLAIAESVHQAGQSNMDRAGGVLDAHAKGARPPEPDIAGTPRTGRSLVLRLALHLHADAAPLPLADGPTPSPRSLAHAALAAWIAAMLPPASEIATLVRAHSPGSSPVATEAVITLAELGIAPIDLVLALKEPRIEPGPPGAAIRALGADADLEDRIGALAAARLGLRPDADLEIAWHAAIAGKVTLFELVPLAGKLRRLAFSSRPLKPSDLLVEGASPGAADAAVSIDPARLAALPPALEALADALDGEAATLEALLAGPPEVAASGLDAAFERAVPLLRRASALNLPQARCQWIRAFLRTQFEGLVAKARATSDRWGEAAARSDAALATLPAATDEQARMNVLRKAELEIAVTASPGATVAALTADVAAARAAFDARRAALNALSTAPINTLSGLIAVFEAAPALRLFDQTPPNADAERAASLSALSDLLDQIRATSAAARARRSRALPLIAGAGDGRGPDRVAALQAAAHALFEDEIDLAPQFAPPQSARADLTSGLIHGAAPDGLLAHVRTIRADPVEEWLTGLARVRDKVHDLEQARLTAETFGRPQPALVPIQAPFRAGEPWLALETPTGLEIDGGRLLYTIAAAPSWTFDPTATQCGLLLDEWQEVLPAREETLGLAFHFDRPNCEPPQAWLLALAPQAEGFWSLDDLIAGIHEALDMAKARAVTPKDIDATEWAHFLPAIVSPATMFDVSITNPLFLNFLPGDAEAELAKVYLEDPS